METRRSEMVLVTNMSMPKTCEDCFFEYDFRCFAGDGDYKDIETYSMGIKPEWCPLDEVEPLGEAYIRSNGKFVPQGRLYKETRK